MRQCNEEQRRTGASPALPVEGCGSLDVCERPAPFQVIFDDVSDAVRHNARIHGVVAVACAEPLAELAILRGRRAAATSWREPPKRTVRDAKTRTATIFVASGYISGWHAL